MEPETAVTRKRLLIEDWLPIAEIGIESVRERRSMTSLPPTYYLHVWWARRPLIASRAAVLASVLPVGADRQQFLDALGIHGDPMAAKARIADADRNGERLGANAYGYKRAFTHSPDTNDFPHVCVLDPTAGGGSIPFEAVRLGQNVIANDLNPVAWLVLMATVDLPHRFGPKLLKRYGQLSKIFGERCKDRIRHLYPSERDGAVPDGYFWARTVKCNYCGGTVPLSTNWILTGKGEGVRLRPIQDSGSNICRFEIVNTREEQSDGTVTGGDAKCPFPGCNETISGDEIKRQAQAGQMGQQLYAIAYRFDKKVGETKSGKPKIKRQRAFRSPREEDDIDALMTERLATKMPEWEAQGIVPDEDRYLGHSDRCGLFGVKKFTQMFSPRQLFSHCTSVEVFQELVGELEADGPMPELDRAALTYVALAIDKLVDWNSL